MFKKIDGLIHKFTDNHIRTVNVTKNVVLSLILKGCSILTGFLIVPVLLKYLGAYNYGIWMTINSVLAWFLFFDLGLGNGLRNKLTEALSRNDMSIARIYVSTTYVMITLIIILLLFFFFLIFPHINWVSFFKAPESLRYELNSVILIVFLFFCIQFILKLAGTILVACQKPALNDSISVIGNIASMVIIFTVSKISTDASILKVAVVFSLTPLITYFIANFLLFFKKYPELKPSYKLFKKLYLKELFTLSFKFFILQIVSMIIFASSNFIILRCLGPDQVTIYSIAFAYMGISNIIFETIRNPFWSAYTEAFHKGDMIWIKRMTRNLTILWIALIFLSIIMILLSSFVFKIWLGNKVHIPILLLIVLGVYFTSLSWNDIYTTVLCGVGKITFQFYYCIINGIIFIPLSIYLCLKFGLIGLVSSIIFTLLPGMIFGPYQYKKIIHFEDRGVWSK